MPSRRRQAIGCVLGCLLGCVLGESSECSESSEEIPFWVDINEWILMSLLSNQIRWLGRGYPPPIPPSQHLIWLDNLRELGPATANPGDAHVKVGSERESATSETLAKFGCVEIGVFLSLFSPRGPSKIGPLLRILVPKRTLSTGGICRPRSMVFIVLYTTQHSLMPSCY